MNNLEKTEWINHFDGVFSEAMETRDETYDEILDVEISEFIIIITIYPLTARVVGAPQMILQPVFSPFFLVLHCPLGPAELQACPFPDVVFPPLFLSALSSSPFHCALQDGFGQT